MAQPISTNNVPEFINREYLTKNFHRMKGEREEGNGRKYTHFVPKQATGITTNVADENEYPIYECNCRREMSRFTREFCVEKPLLEKVEQTFDKKKPLVIYSLGSGGCYTEFSTCVGLAKKGYEVQQIVLADKVYDLQNDPSVVQFTAYAKVLFPNVQISVFNYETEYLDAIKAQKQPKPDIILCIDLEEAFFKTSQYKVMLESSSNQSVLAYHNSVDAYDASKGVKTSIETIQGKSH